jgi:hypothetical protein
LKPKRFVPTGIVVVTFAFVSDVLVSNAFVISIVGNTVIAAFGTSVPAWKSLTTEFSVTATVVAASLFAVFKHVRSASPISLHVSVEPVVVLMFAFKVFVGLLKPTSFAAGASGVDVEPPPQAAKTAREREAMRMGGSGVKSSF